MDLEPDPYGCKFDSLQVTTHDGKKTVGKHCGQGIGSKLHNGVHSGVRQGSTDQNRLAPDPVPIYNHFFCNFQFRAVLKNSKSHI